MIAQAMISETEAALLPYSIAYARDVRDCPFVAVALELVDGSLPERSDGGPVTVSLPLAKVELPAVRAEMRTLPATAVAVLAELLVALPEGFDLDV